MPVLATTLKRLPRMPKLPKIAGMEKSNQQSALSIQPREGVKGIGLSAEISPRRRGERKSRPQTNADER
jgi:hypothetical protein